MAAPESRVIGIGPLTDEEARQKLEQILEIRRQVQAGESLNHYTASLITSTLEWLIRGIFEPIARETKLVLSHEAFMRLSLNDKRAHVAYLLYRGLPILQIEARLALMYALDALNAGAHPPFLRITVRRRGAEPDLAAAARLALVRWIEWQVGSGRTRAEAEREVASAATNVEPGAVRAWKSSLAQVYGSERMRHELEWAREVGRCQANGITYSDLRPSASDRDFLLQQAWAFERDVYKLAAQLNSVRGKRKTAK